MMPRPTLSILPRAETDVAIIYTWLCRRSTYGAQRWIDSLERAIDRIIDDPHLFGSAPESIKLNRHIQQILFKTHNGRTYRGLFVVQDAHIYLLRIRGPGQPTLNLDEVDTT